MADAKRPDIERLLSFGQMGGNHVMDADGLTALCEYTLDAEDLIQEAAALSGASYDEWREWMARSRAFRAEPVKITVNGRVQETSSRRLSFSDVVRMAYGKVPANAKWLTMTYRGRTEGSLQHGSSVPVDAGMLFNVADTSNA